MAVAAVRGPKARRHQGRTAGGGWRRRQAPVGQGGDRLQRPVAIARGAAEARILAPMPDISSWLSVFGAVTGAIGTISGVAGAILGFKGYRRANAMKALDLRLELRRTVSDARSSVEALPKLMADANLSRRAMLNARGMSRSGIMTVWEKSYTADLKQVAALNDELPGEAEEYAKMNDHAGLEVRLIRIHSLARRIADMTTKYERELAKDEAGRNAPRIDIRNRPGPT